MDVITESAVCEHEKRGVIIIPEAWPRITLRRYMVTDGMQMDFSDSFGLVGRRFNNLEEAVSETKSNTVKIYNEVKKW